MGAFQVRSLLHQTYFPFGKITPSTLIKWVTWIFPQ